MIRDTRSNFNPINLKMFMNKITINNLPKITSECII